MNYLTPEMEISKLEPDDSVLTDVVSASGYTEGITDLGEGGTIIPPADF